MRLEYSKLKSKDEPEKARTTEERTFLRIIIDRYPSSL